MMKYTHCPKYMKSRWGRKIPYTVSDALLYGSRSVYYYRRRYGDDLIVVELAYEEWLDSVLDWIPNNVSGKYEVDVDSRLLHTFAFSFNKLSDYVLFKIAFP